LNLRARVLVLTKAFLPGGEEGISATPGAGNVPEVAQSVSRRSPHTYKPMYGPPAGRPHDDYAYFGRFEDAHTGTLKLVARGFVLS